MKDWKKIKVSDLGNVITGNTPPRMNPEFYGNHTIFIKPTDIQEDVRYTRNPEECYSDMGYKKYIKSLIPKGSTCVVTIGSIGKKITQAHCDCFVNQAINAIVPNDFYDNDFIFYLLKNNLNQVKGLDSGTASGRENVSKSTFSSIEIFVPKSIETQQKIASILSAYDDLIENNLRRIKLLEEMAAITYKEWFVNFTIEGEKLAIDETTGLPFGWEYVELGQFIRFKKGKKPNEIFSYYKKGLSKLLLLDGIESGNYPYTNPTNQVMTQNGDLIMLMDGARSGKVFLVEDGVIGSTLAKIEIESDKISSILMKQFMEDNIQTIQVNNTGAAIPHANKNFINSLKFPFAVDSVLLKWNNFSKPCFKTLQNLKSQNRLLKESRDILLPRLMSGTVVA